MTPLLGQSATVTGRERHVLHVLVFPSQLTDGWLSLLEEIHEAVKGP